MIFTYVEVVRLEDKAVMHSRLFTSRGEAERHAIMLCHEFQPSTRADEDWDQFEVKVVPLTTIQ